jgi:hypothetical protein
MWRESPAAAKHNCNQTQLQSSTIAIKRSCNQAQLQSNATAIKHNCSQTQLQSSTTTVKRNCNQAQLLSAHRHKLLFHKLLFFQACSTHADFFRDLSSFKTMS